MKRPLILTLLVSATALLHGQSRYTPAQLDSLHTEARRVSHDSTKAQLYLMLAKATYRSSLDSGLIFAEHGMAAAEATEYQRGRAALYSLMGAIYKSMGDYPKSIEHSLEALRLADPEHDIKILGATHNDLGNLYKQLAEREPALYHYAQAGRYVEQMGYYFGKGIVEVNMGSIYGDEQQYDSAQYYYDKALATAAAHPGLDYVKALAYNNYGEMRARQGRHREALDYYRRTLAFDRMSGDKVGALLTHSVIAMSYAALQQADAARAHVDTSLTLARESGAGHFLSQAYAMHAQVEAELGNYKSAYEIHCRHKILYDSLNDVERTEQIAEMEVKYDTEVKEQENRLLRARSELKDAQLISLGAGAALLLILTFLLYNRRILKQRAAMAHREVAYQEELLSVGIASQEQERKRISRDLHDGVGQQLSGLKMAWQRLSDDLSRKHTTDQSQKLLELTHLLDAATNDVRTISHQMMPRILQENGLVEALDDMLDSTLRPAGIAYEFTHYKLAARYPEEIEVGLYRIAQELVNNALKHARATEIDIQLYHNKGALLLTVEDNGIGFAVSDRSGDGHGMGNMRSRAQALGGKLQIESNPGNGSRFVVRVPIIEAVV